MTPETTRVALDAMGGDHAPGVVVEGAVAYQRAHPGRVHVLLVGGEDATRPLLDKHDPKGECDIGLVPAAEVIGMEESPASAIKTKTGSSIHVGLGLVKAGKAQAFVSAGNTGAVMGGSVFLLGRLAGISRPAVIGYFPTTKGTSVLVDVGANVDCRAEHLLQFAHMGSAYVAAIFGVDTPSVALMNIGEEPGKGNDLTKEAFGLLEASGLNFIGNIEGRDILRHAADVIVCDGFVGNTLLKLGESVASVLPRMIFQEMERLGMGPQDQATVARALEGVRCRFDYEEFGGMPLLGVDGVVMIGHGGSSARAITNLISAADNMVRRGVSTAISASAS